MPRLGTARCSGSVVGILGAMFQPSAEGRVGTGKPLRRPCGFRTQLRRAVEQAVSERLFSLLLRCCYSTSLGRTANVSR